MRRTGSRKKEKGKNRSWDDTADCIQRGYSGTDNAVAKNDSSERLNNNSTKELNSTNLQSGKNGQEADTTIKVLDNKSDEKIKDIILEINKQHHS